jgi:DNA-directed RNA polymerase specialized sigma24 family protein
METEVVGQPEDSVPKLEQAYVAYRGLLFRALASLARRGYPAPADEGLDLVHSFFLEAWEGIRARYRPDAGELVPYVYAAFIRFARPRIVRLNRLRNALVDTDVLSSLPAGSPDPEHEFLAETQWQASLEALKNVWPRLSNDESFLLRTYFGADRPSERELARMFGSSRYETRARLVEALGKVAVDLWEPGTVPEGDRRVALALWKERLAIPEAAASLGLTTHQVKAAHRRNVDRLAKGLHMSAADPRRGPRRIPEAPSPPGQDTSAAQRLEMTDGSRRMLMPPKPTLDATALLTRFLEQPADPDLLREIQARSREILAAIDATHSAIDFNVARSYDAEAMAAFYDALAEGEGASDVPDADSEALWNAYASDRAGVGVAYRELVETLGAAFMNRHFAGLPEVESWVQEEFAQDADVQSAGSAAADLVRHGVTPVLLLRTTTAISDVLDRASDLGLLQHGVSYELSSQTGLRRDRQPVVDAQDFTTVIRGVGACPEATAQALFSWSIDASRQIPLLFDGYATRAKGIDGVVVIHGSRKANLLERWKLAPALLAHA